MPIAKPNPREAALLFLRLVQSRDKERDKPLTRIRLAEITLKRLWNRNRIDDDFLREVVEWLMSVDWVLFSAGSSYAAVRVTAVMNWPRVSSKRIAAEIQAAAEGEYDFSLLEPLLISAPPPEDQGE